MTTAATSGSATVDRFWSQVKKGPGGAHLYVSLLGISPSRGSLSLIRFHLEPLRAGRT